MEDNPSYLKENFNALLGEMNKLKDLIKDSAKSGEQRMDTWSKSVKEKEVEFEVIQKEFRDMPPSSFFTIKARKKLNKKVIETYKLVKVLREMADEISQIMETFISKVATEKALRFSPWQIRKYTSNFQTEILGSGGFGVVYAGELPNGVKIAVKKLRDGLMMHDIENQFMAEVRTMNASYHRNLAKLYGFCFCSELKALVYEYMEKGSFDKLLFDKRQNPSWRNLHGVAIETAKAISYLHDNCHDEQIIHRDIKAGNVLLDSKYTAKVSDFGLAKLCNRDKTHLSITGLREMRGYDAPEVRMDTPKITSKCDTFSFGIMLFEILSRTICDLENSFPRQVWEKYKNGNLDEMVTKCGIREKHKKESAKTVCIIAFWCLQYLPATRPSMSIVVKALEGDIIFTPPPNPFDPSSITASACISRASSTTTR